MRHALTLERPRALAQAIWITGFAALTAVAAHVTIPHLPVPYTLQTFVVLAAGGVLGARNGALSQLAYLAAGAAGLPVFAAVPDGTIGLASLFGPTGGYLLAFPVAAFVAGFVYERTPKLVWRTGAMALAMLVIFVLGTAQLCLVVTHDWPEAFRQGFLIFSWWDGLKIAGAIAAAHLIGSRP